MTAKTLRGAVKRDKILAAAKHLFARQGFGSTGVRQIAEQAEVNPAMISYYFGSKQGLLDAVLAGYFDAIVPRAFTAMSREQSVRDAMHEVVTAFVELFRDDLELVRILLSQLPLDRAEHTAFPQERLADVVDLVNQRVLSRLEQELGVPVPFQIAMPAMLGLVLSHFLSRPMFERLFSLKYDDDFYARFPDVVVGILIDGFRGLSMVAGNAPSTATDTATAADDEVE